MKEPKFYAPLSEYSNAKKKCPILLMSSRNPYKAECIQERCSFWCEFGNSCAVPLLAEMFADSDICRNVFDKE